MKTFAWLSVASLALLCGICVPLIDLTQSVYKNDFRDGSWPAPTELVMRLRMLFPFLPIPWAVYAIILGRRSAPVDAYFAFAGTIILVVSIVICFVLMALLAPYFSTHTLIGTRHNA